MICFVDKTVVIIVREAVHVVNYVDDREVR